MPPVAIGKIRKIIHAAYEIDLVELRITREGTSISPNRAFFSGHQWLRLAW